MLTNTQLAAMMERPPTACEHLMDVLYDKSSPKGWDKLADICLLLSAREEGMTVADYCRMNIREIPMWAYDGGDA